MASQTPFSTSHSLLGFNQQHNFPLHQPLVPTQRHTWTQQNTLPPQHSRGRTLEKDSSTRSQNYLSNPLDILMERATERDWVSLEMHQVLGAGTWSRTWLIGGPNSPLYDCNADLNRAALPHRVRIHLLDLDAQWSNPGSLLRPRESTFIAQGANTVTSSCLHQSLEHAVPPASTTKGTTLPRTEETTLAYTFSRMSTTRHIWEKLSKIQRLRNQPLGKWTCRQTARHWRTLLHGRHVHEAAEIIVVESAGFFTAPETSGANSDDVSSTRIFFLPVDLSSVSQSTPV